MTIPEWLKVAFMIYGYVCVVLVARLVIRHAAALT